MNLVQPTAEMSVSIRAELREPESPEDIEKDIVAIREWLSRQPHLPKDMGTDHLIILLPGLRDHKHELGIFPPNHRVFNRFTSFFTLQMMTVFVLSCVDANSAWKK